MCFRRVGIRLVLHGLKIVKYIEYIVSVSRQNELQRSRETEMPFRSVLLTCMAVRFATFMIHATQ